MKLKAHAVLVELNNNLTVNTHWDGAELDRPHTRGYDLGPANNANKKLALRLIRAIEADAVYHDAKISLDVNGKSYVSAYSRVSGRRINADLKRLGF